MLAVLVGSCDPAGAVDDAGVEEVAQLRGALGSEDRVVEVEAGADVALDEFGVHREVLGGGGFEVDLAVREHAGPGGPVEVDFAVAGQADDDDLAGAVGMGEGADDVLQRVRGRPLAVGAGVVRVRGGDEGLDRRRVRGVLDVGGRGASYGIAAARSR